MNTNHEPNTGDLMWCDGCDHEFERYGDAPKRWLTEWECITIFNNFVSANKIRIRSHQICGNDFNDSFVIERTADILDEQYVNYDVETDSFISLEEFYPDLYADLDERSSTVCTICLQTVAEENVIEHLNNCSGLTFSINQSDLLILKVMKSNQN